MASWGYRRRAKQECCRDRAITQAGQRQNHGEGTRLGGRRKPFGGACRHGCIDEVGGGGLAQLADWVVLVVQRGVQGIVHEHGSCQRIAGRGCHLHIARLLNVHHRRGSIGCSSCRRITWGPATAVNQAAQSAAPLIQLCMWWAIDPENQVYLLLIPGPSSSVIGGGLWLPTDELVLLPTFPGSMRVMNCYCWLLTDGQV